MSKLSLANIIRVTLISALRGLSNVNTSALAIITDEVPIPGDFGTSRTYLEPTAVAQDFGSNSETARIATVIFNQVPNILAGGGFLVVIPRLAAASASPATILSDSFVDLTKLTAADYNINAAIDGGVASDLLIGSIDSTDLATAAASLNSTAVAAAGMTFSLSGDVTAARVTLVSDTTGATSDLTLAAAGTGTDIAVPLEIALKEAVGSAAGTESIKDCILRTNGIVDYFGIVYNEIMTDTILQEVAALVQSLDKLQFVGSNIEATMTATTGVFDIIKNAGYTHTRCLYYSVSVNDAIDFAAGYASRGMSVNFNASNTAITIHGKKIVGLVGDPGVEQTELDTAKLAGVDVYGDFGVPKIFSSGANQFFDQTYNRLAFQLRLTVAGFNAIMTIPTKIVQTEEGMNVLKKAFRLVCKLFVTNGVFAPGAWNSPTTFGVQADHIRNIAEKGFYIYSLPIAQQAQTERNIRVAPVVQIAAKESGAIHSSDVTAFVEA
jgi:hypothetical protein